MSFGLRVRQCPRSGIPRAVKNWSPSACSSSIFFGATTARTDRPPALFCRSRILMVLPAPGSATMRCQERLSQASCSIAWNLRAKAVSMKMSFLKGECVIVAAPLATRSERVRHVQDDQVRHPGRLAVGSRVQVSWPRYLLSAQRRWLDECPGVGDPIDGFARFDESLRCGVCVLTLVLATWDIRSQKSRFHSYEFPQPSLCVCEINRASRYIENCSP